MKKIKRCPFCGSEARLIDLTGKDDFDNPMAWVLCTGCGISTNVFKSRGYAIAVWNRRQDKPKAEVCQECGVKPVVFNRAINGKIETQLICPNCRSHTAWHEDDCDAIDEWNGGDR